MKLRHLAAAILPTIFAVGVVVGMDHHTLPDPTKHWQKQTYQDCAEMSAAAIIGALTGTTPTEAAITTVARDVTDYDPDKGTSIDTMPALFRAYGLVAAEESYLDLAQVVAWIKRGYLIQAFVNAETIWSVEGYDVTPGTTLDHAVVLRSVDSVHGLVHLVDSATQADEVVPTAVFMQAWAASFETAMVISK